VTRYLADTHILIWTVNQPERLPPTVKGALSDPAGQACFSPVSIWEIAIKHSLGKLDLNGHSPEELLGQILASGFTCERPSVETIASSHRLPRRHKDPFDRLIVWQAISQGLTLLSVDSVAALYAQDGLRHLCA
jgi:PIN domain nuclease of toxin-antitoxin system